MARRMYRGRGGRRRRPANLRRRRLSRVAKSFRRTGKTLRRRVNNHTFIRGQAVVIANVDSPEGPYPVVVQGTTTDFPQPSVIVGEVSPYGNTTSWTSSMTFAMNRTVNANELTVLYDQYMIKHVDMEFAYSHDSSTADGSGTPMPSIMLVPDFDDNAIETRVQQLQSVSRMYRRSLKNVVRYRITPRIRDSVGTDTTSGVANVGVFKRMWLNCESPGVPHYGLKCMVYDWPLENVFTGGEQMSRPILRVTMKYHLMMKNVR